MGVCRARRLKGAELAWGEELTPGKVHMANTWHGDFPRQNQSEDGYERTSPVTAFPPNAYGVHDMIGNVWEWTTDWYAPKHEADAPKACCIPENPRGGWEEGSYDPRQPNIRIARKVVKGGSHLCAPNCCRVPGRRLGQGAARGKATCFLFSGLATTFPHGICSGCRRSHG